jgi:molybdopterin-guanine dinucleotide biosynthesis protein A
MVSAVLAGGENTRFPFLKGFIEIEGRRLIERNIERLNAVTGQVVISVNEPENYFYLGVPLIGDVVEPRGPASGIVSVLLCTGADEVFVTACDMPFINTELIRYIINNRAGDATVPVFNERPEPLFAVYSKGVTVPFEEGIREGRSSLTDMLKKLDVCYIEEEDVRRIDPEGRSFLNINDLDDYETAFRDDKKAV